MSTTRRDPTYRRIIVVKLTVKESLYLEAVVRMDSGESESEKIRRTAKRIHVKLLKQMLNPKAFPHK